MFVKALRIAGFKSFADPTLLEFEPGVNVIVGPNGSGKSNISDALSWVLGSQAPSTLRGASMEDVIFAGSAGRPRLGMAEVQLTLDNSSRVLPLDLSEVTISRSADRAGTSEYKINGAPCRLLDIAELLSDTGIGRSIHTIVGQGQLDAVLQARPEDRRAFIEEAAQIGKYRRRKDRALRKIERVEDNLMRLNDVLAELKRAIRPLKRQANAAAMYSELMGRHRDLRQRLTATEILRLDSLEGAADPEVERHKAQLLSEELATVRARLGATEQEREALAGAAERSQQTAHRIGRAADRYSGLQRLARERVESLTARLAAETEEGYRERIRLLDRDRARWTSELETMRGRANETRSRAEQEAERARSLSEALEEAERRLARCRTEEIAAAQALVRAEGSEAAGRATLGSIEARVRAVMERRAVMEHALTEDQRSVLRCEQECRGLEKDLDAATEAAAAAETRLESAREAADEIRVQLGSSEAGRSAAVARVEAFEEVTGLFPDRPEVVGRIEPLLIRARDVARIATTGESELRNALSQADDRVEELWLDVAKKDEELRRLDALMSGAAERAAGARRQHETHEIELAALDDELSRARDALASAERAAAEERASLPARQAAVDEMRELRERAEARLSEARELAAQATADKNRVELDLRAADERALAAQLRLEEAEAGIADAQAALEGLEDLRATLDASRVRAVQVALTAEHAASVASGWLIEADANAQQARDEAREGERRLSGLHARERELAQQLEEVARRRNEAEVRRAESRARIAAIGERAMDEWGLSIEELMQIEALDAESEVTTRAEADKLERDMRRLGAVNPHAAEEYAELAEREGFLESQIEDLRSSKRDLMKVVHEVDETIVEVFGNAFKDVAREFEGVFERLFPGGTGRLKLMDEGDLLGSGIDIEARPPGKNVRKLSLLSGGERSLVALAFLFAIFRSRPSPFYLLDEVEAALDDVNLHRFLGLIEELEERAQVLIVTHQKRTMESGDVLYGVSMAKDGVSNVIAKRMEEVTV